MKTRRWNDPAQADEGLRILITRYRPRGVRKQDETWDEWWKELGPSVELHAAFWGKQGQPIGWDEYRRRYLEEMAHDPGRTHLRALAAKIDRGERVTLLCSSACTDEARCHRTIVRDLVAKQRAH